MDSITVAINKMNTLASKGEAFLFLFDFEMKNPLVYRIDEINPDEIVFEINGKRNFEYPEKNNAKLSFEKKPVLFEQYRAAFTQVMEHLNYGNSYLLNLTFPTLIETNFSLKDIFYKSVAKYKLLYKNQFVVFSPEIFIKITDSKICSYPMKGTINASIRDSEHILLNNKKEIAEHATIVDLIRNDLNRFAKNVRVNKFRYIDRIKAHDKEILQVSSEIMGDLPPDYKDQIGDILFSLLPAGSICGAPKKKTVEIIQEVENYKRGYYTGVFGYFDGKNLDSGVMIRFIENTPEGLIYKSGGGITVNSRVEEEYQELMDKVYVPVI